SFGIRGSDYRPPPGHRHGVRRDACQNVFPLRMCWSSTNMVLSAQKNRHLPWALFFCAAIPIGGCDGVFSVLTKLLRKLKATSTSAMMTRTIATGAEIFCIVSPPFLLRCRTVDRRVGHRTRIDPRHKAFPSVRSVGIWNQLCRQGAGARVVGFP